jgi:hypothetical protein
VQKSGPLNTTWIACKLGPVMRLVEVVNLFPPGEIIVGARVQEETVEQPSGFGDSREESDDSFNFVSGILLGLFV